ncbi:hypothetical protein Cgig2_026995 [Carnegiea gigantea]|uniref:Uncharacterized protein n=1 Tax=Carnegiea gigantea TaxID=171969 RepID=A0A9Q1Q844_9CARY|nr:hypothetical protein Cgig2_026995 [Carnegiea gigantea]
MKEPSKIGSSRKGNYQNKDKKASCSSNIEVQEINCYTEYTPIKTTYMQALDRLLAKGKINLPEIKPETKLIMEELNKIDMSSDTMSEEMIASIITSTVTITFNSEDLPLRGIAHNNTLYLNTTCLQKHVPLSLLDNGSVVNVYPLRIVKRWGIRANKLSTAPTHLRAYDNLRRLVLGTILLPINVGFIEKNMEFQVRHPSYL